MFQNYVGLQIFGRYFVSANESGRELLMSMISF